MTGTHGGNRGDGDGAGDVSGGPSPREIDAGARSIAGLIALLFAGGMHLVVGAFLALAWRLVPGAVLAMLVGAWFLLGMILWRWHHRRPLATLFVPFVGAGLLWATLALGRRAGWGA